MLENNHNRCTTGSSMRTKTTAATTCGSEKMSIVRLPDNINKDVNVVGDGLAFSGMDHHSKETVFS